MPRIEVKDSTEGVGRWNDSGQVLGGAEQEREEVSGVPAGGSPESCEVHGKALGEETDRVLTGLGLTSAAQKTTYAELCELTDDNDLAGAVLAGVIIGLTAQQLAEE